MPATQSFNHVDVLQLQNDGSYRVVQRSVVAVQVADAGHDGSLSNGEVVVVNGDDQGGRYHYSGFTDGHGGIFVTDSLLPANQLRLFSANGYANGAVVTPVPQASLALCFCAGTRIATDRGDRLVESLSIGDAVLNTAGAAVPVKWIGRQRRSALFAAVHHQLPIRIGAGALGDGLPRRDLYVSPDHALLVDGCLVHASALVNGRSIRQMTHCCDEVEYFHIETEAHELILAEGAAAETFIDNVSRASFDNHAEYAALYPDPAPMQQLALPRVYYARQLPKQIARRLDAVADRLSGVEAIAA